MLAVYICVKTLRSPTNMSSPNFRRNVVTSTRIECPRPLKMKALRSFEIQKLLTKEHGVTHSSHFRLLSTVHVLAVSITSSRLCLPRVGNTLRKVFGKPINSQWMHFVTSIGVTVELRSRLNVTCVVFEEEVRTAQ